jgi:hypothetical protein
MEARREHRSKTELRVIFVIEAKELTPFIPFESQTRRTAESFGPFPGGIARGVSLSLDDVGQFPPRLGIVKFGFYEDVRMTGGKPAILIMSRTAGRLGPQHGTRLGDATENLLTP